MDACLASGCRMHRLPYPARKNRSRRICCRTGRPVLPSGLLKRNQPPGNRPVRRMRNRHSWNRPVRCWPACRRNAMQHRSVRLIRRISARKDSRNHDCLYRLTHVLFRTHACRTNRGYPSLFHPFSHSTVSEPSLFLPRPLPVPESPETTMPTLLLSHQDPHCRTVFRTSRNFSGNPQQRLQTPSSYHPARCLTTNRNRGTIWVISSTRR